MRFAEHPAQMPNMDADGMLSGRFQCPRHNRQQIFIEKGAERGNLGGFQFHMVAGDVGPRRQVELTKFQPAERVVRSSESGKGSSLLVGPQGPSKPLASESEVDAVNASMFLKGRHD